jgi:nuclear pore complex protein Nup133
VDAGTDQLDHRFENIDASIRERLMKNMQAERDALRPYLDTSQLEKWCRAALDLARDDFRREVDAETDEGQSMRLAALKLQEIEEGIAQREQDTARAALQSKPRPKRKAKLDGSLTRFKASLR